MTAYRDSFAKCPRCGIELRDAGSATRCERCGGLFVEEAILTEMIQQMLPPGPFVRLALGALAHSSQSIGCPSCGEQMEQTKLLDVPIERCAKHGVWFDRDELARALYRASITPPQPAEREELAAPVAEPAPPDEPKPFVFDPGAFADPPAAQVEPAPAPIHETIAELPSLASHMRFDRTERTIALHVREPDGRTTTVGVMLYFDIGRGGPLSSAGLILPHASVSPTHASLHVERDRLTLTDLASTTGTFVNGTRISKRTVQPGDEIQIGVYRLRVDRPFPEQLFEQYIAAALADRGYDPLVVRVDQLVGQRDFHTFVKLSIQSLKMEGKVFRFDSHPGLRDALVTLSR